MKGNTIKQFKNLEFIEQNNISSSLTEQLINYDTTEDILDKHRRLSRYDLDDVINKIDELLLLEPKRKGRPPASIAVKYDRLSPTSKKEITDYINHILEIELNGIKISQNSIRKAVVKDNIIMIDFRSSSKRNKDINALADSFIAYETSWSFGLLGYLRHKFNCKDKSRENLKSMINDMNTSLSLLSDEQKKLFKQTSNSCFMDKDISLTVTEGQRKILQYIQDTCESELLIDLCNDFQIKVVNNWKVSIVFTYKPDENIIKFEGDRLDIENFLAGRNAYF